MSEDIDALIDLCEQIDQKDLAVAVERVTEAIEESEDNEIDVADHNVVLPFYEDSREFAFLVGLSIGGLLEEQYGDDEDEDEE